MVTIKKTVIGGVSLAALASGHAIGKRDGTIITSCTETGVVALTFDDGPYIYSQHIVDQLTAAGHRATFFQNGDNYGDIYTYGPLLTSMIAGGHQIGSHTWNHADLATLDEAGVTSEMSQLETAHLALIGKAPTYMRPPYLSTTDATVSILTKLGYKIIEVDNDTQDWAEGPLGLIDLSIAWYKTNLTAGGRLSLNHDPYEPTADTFVPAIITYLDSLNLKSVPVGECLGDPPANWYRGQGSVPSASASASAAASGSASLPSASAHPSGNGTAPSGTYPSNLPKPSGSGGKKPCGGGDTEPGHGADAGRGAIPGHKGTGNDGWTGSYGSSNSSGSGAAATTGYTAPKASGSYTGPYSNGANALTGSALALCGAALLAFLL